MNSELTPALWSARMNKWILNSFMNEACATRVEGIILVKALKQLLEEIIT